MDVKPGDSVSFVDRLGQNVTGKVARSFGGGAVVVQQTNGRRRMALTSELKPIKTPASAIKKRSRPAKHK